MNYKQAGERIYFLRIERGYTRENLAELASISSKFLYEIETGKKGFSAVVLYNICHALNVNCDYILTGNKIINKNNEIDEVLKLFNKKQMERIYIILEQIHELL